MRYRTAIAIAAGAVGLALAFGVGVAVGENAPTGNKGMKVSPPTALDLGPEIDGVQGRQLRLRVVTLEPGGVVGIHSHKGRPGVAYVLQGTLTEHREGAGVQEHHEGESWTEGKDTTHWAENKGDKPVMVLAVDVFKP
ncbi:MAG TPA: cupin domain-containing protein [Burkholderiales bacterium]|nr:cupin domain-containing protein [Burkholderiales bacterium]